MSIPQKRLEAAGAYTVLILLLIFVGFPFIWLISTSFKPNEEIFAAGLNILPSRISFEHYRNVFTYGKLGIYFKNSVIVALSTVILSFFSVIPASYAISILRTKGSNFISKTVLMFQMVPSILLLIPLYLLMKRFGLINTSFSLILSYVSFTIPFCFLFSKSYFDEIPHELFESAFVDGCNNWKAFLRIGLPIAAPGLMVTSVFSFILAWNDFMFANTFVNSEQTRTLTIGIANMQSTWGVQWGPMTAAATITVLPVLTVFVIANKYIIEGLTAGAVKG